MHTEVVPNQKVQEHVRGFPLDPSAESWQLRIATFEVEGEGKLPNVQQICHSRFEMKEVKTSGLLIAVFKSELGLNKSSEMKS